MEGNGASRGRYKKKGPRTQPARSSTRNPFSRHGDSLDRWSRQDAAPNRNHNVHGSQDNLRGSSAAQMKKQSGFGFKRLDSLSKQTSIQIMEIFSNEQTLAEFSCLASQADLKDDFIKRIVIILGKLSRAEFHQIVVQSLSRISSSSFLSQMLFYIVRWQEDEELEESAYQEAFDFFDNLAAYCRTVINLLPTLACEKLMPIIKSCNSLLESKYFHNVEKVKEVMNVNLEKLTAEKDKRKAQPVKKTLEEEALQFSSPPEDFRELSTVPMTHDLLRTRCTFLRPSIVEGPYNNVEHYLDVQFRLIKEDFVRPLRDGIREYIHKKREAANEPGKGKRIRINNIKIYEDVVIGKAEIFEDKVGFFVRFDPHNKFCSTINWDQSKRFMHGSLLILTRNGFESIVLATVLRRHVEDLSKGMLLIEIIDNGIDCHDLSKTRWTMAESSLFFGAYSHVLDALKKFDEVSFPLKEYIVRGQNAVELPDYLHAAQGAQYTLPLPSASVKKNDGEDEDDTNNLFAYPHNDQSWPSAAELGLDGSQYEAFKGALTQKVMLIQGPPGTGKTYLGLRIASVLLNNSDYWHDDSKDDSLRPLVVVCYTNHALDQFLMGLTCFTQSIVRVGGGSKEKNLERFALRNLRRNRDVYYRGKHLFEMLRGYREKFATLKQEYQSLETSRAMIENGAGIIDPECLFNFGVISDHQLYSFEDRNDFMDWLEGSFSLRGHHRNLGQILEDVICEGSSDDGKQDLYFIIGFTKTDEAQKKAENSFVVSYYHQKKVYLLNQLKGTSTNPEKLDMTKVNRLRSLQQLQIEERWQLYRYWVNDLLKILNQRADSLQPELLKAAANLKEAKMVEDQDVMSTCKVIGMTTSYAAKQQPILKQLRPRIVIVEEAAEVLEAHVVVSLTGSVEHLIMIGDHLQLKPNPAVYELGTKYHLNVSLFERLINNKVQCVSLTTQHRMRPEIAKLVCPTIYPLLINHESVWEYPSIRGVTRNVAFVHHKHHQEEVEEIQSFRNVHEAEFISGMVKYLILQGYKSSQITVLATYKGQMFYLHKLRQEHPSLGDVRITVVDNYQGEENDIILLSLVRSNDDGEVGFLKIENRVCVALSRAKHGLFIIGNMDNLKVKGDIWPKVSQVLQDQNALVEALELRCEVHSTVTRVSCGDDFKNVPEGGCLLQCGTLMPCGHTCLQLCHATNRDHSTSKCFEPCNRPVCAKNHICPDKCYMECKPCMVPTDVVLPCGHPAQIPCHIELSQYKCLEVITCTLPCKHEQDVPCYQSKQPGEIRCLEPCQFRVPDCGHACEWRCHIFNDPTHEMYKCTKPCEEKNKDCKADHPCKKACHQDCDTCVIMVKKKLPCDHMWTMECHKEPSRKFCGNRCPVVCESCGQKCKKKCKDDCHPCLTEVEKTVPGCEHKQIMFCGTDPASFTQCTARCNRKLISCGHPCSKLCSEECLTECQEMVPYPKPTVCGHTILVPCSKKHLLEPNSPELLDLCTEPCRYTLQPCSHRCRGTCGSCWQGQLHEACKEPCGRVLVCGHSCKAPCAAMCPPCKEPCLVKCVHSACGLPCGRPCPPCRMKCDRKCEHNKCTRLCGDKCNSGACQKPCGKTLKACRHKCIGLCGDPCICVECNEGIRGIFFGSEDQEDARFVMLPDCKHIFESSGLQQWLLQDSSIEQGRIGIKEKVCPRCNTAIRKCLRYSEIITKHANDVQAVKHKVFGNVKDVSNIARQGLEIISAYIPKEFSECTSLKMVISKKLSDMNVGQKKTQKKQRKWSSPHFSLGEAKNLLEYAKVVSILSGITRKALIPLATGVKPPQKNLMSRLTAIKTDPDPGYKLNEKSRNLVTNFVEKVAKKLRVRNVLRLSSQEAQDIAAVQRKLDILLQLCFIESSPIFSTMSSLSKQNYSSISDRVRGSHYYLDSEHSADCKSLNIVAEEVKVRITQAEIRSVVSAMGMSVGHWFKCPNGHVYAIGDCGGATMESKCNECGAKIGGGSHRLRSDNSFAPEMDGATSTAWPGTAMNPT